MGPRPRNGAPSASSPPPPSSSLDLLGNSAPSSTRPWHQLVTAAGYLGLLSSCPSSASSSRGAPPRLHRMERALVSVSDINARLKKLDAEKNEFLGIVAHDLKNPLNIVMGFAELISTGRHSSHERTRRTPATSSRPADRMISSSPSSSMSTPSSRAASPRDRAVRPRLHQRSGRRQLLGRRREKRHLRLLRRRPHARPASWPTPRPPTASSITSFQTPSNTPPPAPMSSSPPQHHGRRPLGGQDHGAGLTAADQARLSRNSPNSPPPPPLASPPTPRPIHRQNAGPGHARHHRVP